MDDRFWPGAVTIKKSSDHVLTAINMQEFAWRYGRQLPNGEKKSLQMAGLAGSDVERGEAANHHTNGACAVHDVFKPFAT
jgi:hypothetical protein